jgi:glucose/arabinose dehydrogenase
MRAHRFLSYVLPLSLAAWASPATRSATLPSGFAETQVVGLSAVGSFAFDPDGRIWMTQHTGTSQGFVWVRQNGLTTLALTLSIDSVQERGPHTIVVDPDFPTNHHVWIYYTNPGPPVANRVSRFTLANGALGDEQVVLQGPATQDGYHNGGCLEFGADKTLYLGMGEDLGGTAFAQDPNNLRGKILRINRDGSAVADNPWVSGGGDPRVWAIGLRNPFRCRMQPGLDNLFIGDVGSFRWEEINVGIRGANFGWETVEGYTNPGVAGMVYPIYAYNSRLPDGTGAAIIAGDFAKPGDFAPEYEGNFFFADWLRNELHRMVLTEDLQPSSVTRFATDVIRPSEVRFGPDGALYYNNRQGLGGTQGIWRIAYVGGSNRQPVPASQATPDSGPAPLSVVLDATGSSDPDQDPLTYAWDLGDGGTSPDAMVGHAYPQGVHTARVNVTDDGGLSALGPPLRIVSGNRRPTAVSVTPAPGATFNAGGTILYSGTGSDPEDGTLACAKFTWQILFHHNDHVHAYLGPIQGACNGSFVTATRGETETSVWYEVRLTVEDSGQPIGATGKLTGHSSVDVHPNLGTLQLATVPPNLAVELDHVAAPAPVSTQGVVGLIRAIGAPDGQVAGGRTWTWLGWSDGGAREHEISTPAGTTTFTASFGCNVLAEATNLSIGVAPNNKLSLTWDPVVDTCLTTGSPRYRIYSAPTARPTVPPGHFPTDPAFTLIGTTNNTTFDYTPGGGSEYFLVVAVGTDGKDGEAGSY